MGEKLVGHVGKTEVVFLTGRSWCDGCGDYAERLILIYAGIEESVQFCPVHARELMEHLRFFIQGGVQGV